MPYEPPFDVPKVPGLYLRFNNSLAVGDPDVPHRAVLVGVRLSTGTVAANIPRQVSSHDQAKAYWGEGSMIAEMARVFLEHSKIEVWGIGVDEDALGAEASGTLAFSGLASAAGTLQLLIAGQRVRVGLVKGDAAADVVDKVVAELADMPGLPVVAVGAGDDVAVSARWKGLTGNAIDLRLDPTGALPSGISLTITAMAGGATDPEIDGALAALGDDVKYDTVAIGFNDTVNLGHLDAWLETRWGELVQLEGIGFAADTGSYAALTTLASGLNSKFLVVTAPGSSPTPFWLWAAATASVDAQQTKRQPNAPRLGIVLERGISPPAQEERFSFDERNTLLANGISTVKGTASGRAQLERLLTTYTHNEDGFSDGSYSDLGVMRTLHRLRYELQVFRSRYKDWLISDDESLGAHPKVMTPGRMRKFLSAAYVGWQAKALVQDFAFFKDNLQVALAANKQDLHVFVPADIVRGLNTVAGEIAFV